MVSSTQLRMALAAAILMASLPQKTEALKSPGTPKNLKKIFIHRCRNYQNLVNPEPFKQTTKDCTELWGLFFEAFAYKTECGVEITDFNDFVEGVYHTNPPGKVLFWSKVTGLQCKGFVNRGRLFSLECTLGGYILDGLTFCGQEDASGLNYDSCPDWSECDYGETTHAMRAVWKGLSKQFAANAEGQVFGVFNGSYGQAYNHNSIFASVELPNLYSYKVTKFTVMVVHDSDKPRKESCGTGSFVKLVKDIEIKEIPVECIDDPAMAKKECQCQSGCARRHVSYAGFALAALLLYT